MDDMNIFIPITKVDAARRLVYGVVTAEAPDITGEVCDYASTKPLYQKWSQKFADATDGQSFGNLRAMHSNVAAGKLVDIAFDDEHKRIEICGKVVDDAEWAKVEEGVYTGFSQGGRYLKRWPDPDEPKLMRYTAEPVEVSLVDHPCLPEATFAVVKADGSTELRKFKAGDRQEPLSEASLRVERSTPAFGVSEFGLLRRPVGASRNDEAIAKVGARHSKADKERIKQSHDLLVALDPDCCPGGIFLAPMSSRSRNLLRRPASMATSSTLTARPKNSPRASNVRCNRHWPRRSAACTRAWTISARG